MKRVTSDNNFVGLSNNYVEHWSVDDKAAKDFKILALIYSNVLHNYFDGPN